ncbi:MAG: glycosyltransferase family 9 protein [Bacteroidota bacterium]
MKILVIQMKMIGDVLTSSILFEALRKKYPEAELHYLIYKQTQPVVENNPFIDKFILYEEKDKKPYQFIKFLNKIRKENYSIVIDVYSKIGSAFISFYSGANIRISYDKKLTRSLYTDVFSRDIKAKTIAGPAIEKRLRLLNALGSAFPSEIKPKIYLTEKEINSARQLLDRAGLITKSPLFMISVLGSSKAKNYPQEYLAVLLDQIVEDTQGNLIFNYIPSQKEQAKAVYDLCNSKTQKAIHLEIFGKSLREFLALTAQCDALIGNEGGAVNMAKAIGIHCFAIFSPGVKKENWSMYDDDITQVSVHLQDFIPEIFQNKSKKELHSLNAGFYTKFKPELISAKLNQFLQRIKT